LILLHEAVVAVEAVKHYLVERVELLRQVVALALLLVVEVLEVQILVEVVEAVRNKVHPVTEVTVVQA
jgi:hypothetical protein